MDSLGQNPAGSQPGCSYTQNLLAFDVSSGKYYILHPQDLSQSPSMSSVCDVADPPEPSTGPHEWFGSATNPPYLKGDSSKNLPSSNANSQVQILTPSDELEMVEFPSLPPLNPDDLIQTVKPPHSFLDLIIMALEDAPEKKLTSRQIFRYVVDKFPYYRQDKTGWQNSIRHTLSVNHCFKRADMVQSTQWQGSYWTLDQSCMKMLKNGKLQGKRKRYTCDSALSKKMDDKDDENSSGCDNISGSPTSEVKSSPDLQMSPQLTAAINAMMSDGASTEVSEDLSPSTHYYTVS